MRDDDRSGRLPRPGLVTYDEAAEFYSLLDSGSPLQRPAADKPIRLDYDLDAMYVLPVPLVVIAQSEMRIAVTDEFDLELSYEMGKPADERGGLGQRPDLQTARALREHLQRRMDLQQPPPPADTGWWQRIQTFFGRGSSTA